MKKIKTIVLLLITMCVLGTFSGCVTDFAREVTSPRSGISQNPDSVDYGKGN